MTMKKRPILHDGDFDIGNVAVGGKGAIVSTDSTVLTAGLEVIAPTTSNNNGALLEYR